MAFPTSLSSCYRVFNLPLILFLITTIGVSLAASLIVATAAYWGHTTFPLQLLTLAETG
ncbi:MAG: hypothetical protein JOY54_05745 [Acidobacteriaceae bacterium]|nr:hypothetical protein [Acidobacteriaceae bacterium]